MKPAQPKYMRYLLNFTTVLWLAPMVLAIYGIFAADFITSQAFITKTQVYTYTLYIILYVFFLFSLIKQYRLPPKQNAFIKYLKNLIILFFFVIFNIKVMLFLAKFSVQQAIPAILHKFSQEEYQEHMMIVVFDNYVPGRINEGFILHAFTEDNRTVRIGGISTDFLKQRNKGDHIILKGKKSYFGLRVESYGIQK